MFVKLNFWECFLTIGSILFADDIDMLFENDISLNWHEVMRNIGVLF